MLKFSERKEQMEQAKKKKKKIGKANGHSRHDQHHKITSPADIYRYLLHTDAETRLVVHLFKRTNYSEIFVRE